MTSSSGMETGKPQKQQARTSLGSAEIWTSCTEGCGWVWLENACNPDGDCQDGWENRVAYRDREGFLGPESIEPTIHKSTTLNGVTKGAILYGALQGGKVLVIPHQPMVHFIESGTKKPDVGRVVGAPLYKKGDRSVVLMKMQFSGGPGTIYRVFLADDSHKMESDDGEITAVDIPAHAELLYHAALRISYPQVIKLGEARGYTNHTRYMVLMDGEDLGMAIEPPEGVRNRLLQVGQLETRIVDVGGRKNIEWY